VEESPAQQRKLRQAAFVYLHLGVLYEGAVYAMARRGVLVARGPAERAAPTWIWLLIGAAIVALVFWLLWSRKSVWTARVVWAMGLFRIPALIEGAFFPPASALVPQAFYLIALAVVLLNLWALARAGWDL
jgi:hypothetical protein